MTQSNQLISSLIAWWQLQKINNWINLSCSDKANQVAFSFLLKFICTEIMNRKWRGYVLMEQVSFNFLSLTFSPQCLLYQNIEIWKHKNISHNLLLWHTIAVSICQQGKLNIHLIAILNWNKIEMMRVNKWKQSVKLCIMGKILFLSATSSPKQRLTV